MQTSIDSSAFDRGIDPVLQVLTMDQARSIVQYRSDPGLEARIETLAQRSNQGELTSDEQAEYEGYVRANKFVAILQAKARQLLGSSKP